MTPKDEDGNYDFERIEAIDTKQLNADMSALLRGETVELPSFNFKTGKREYKGRFKKLEKNDVLVIEGIHGLNDRLTYALPRESKFRIYISALTQLNIDEHNRIPTTDGRLFAPDCAGCKNKRNVGKGYDRHVGFGAARRGRSHFPISGRSGCDV